LLYSFEDFSLDTARRELRRSGALIALQPQVFDLLEYSIGHRDRVVSKDDLPAAVWNGRIVSESTLSTRINGHAARSATAAENNASFAQHTAKESASSESCARKKRRSASSRRSLRPMSQATAG
jgi:hypothetical protein